MASEFTFTVEKTCPVCGAETRIVKVKSRLVAQKIDEDYCCHYKDFNPYLYHIWACEHCGFAADEKVFLTHMADKNKEKMQAFLKEKRVRFRFTEERTVPDGLASLQLAIYCAELLKAPLARLAGLTLRLAWIFRLINNEEQERIYTRKALEMYERSLASERYPIDNLTDSMVMYLIGALHARLGQRDQAIMYLSRLVGDKEAKISDAKLYQDARRLWQDIRSDKDEA